jgi:putative ABC transport system permease protein
MTHSRAVFLLEAFWRDLRFASRSLRKRPGITLIVVISLALGIGANTAIFSLIDATLLRPLPVPNPNGLVAVDVAASRLTQFGSSSYLDYVDFSTRSKSFDSLEISQGMSAGLSTGHGDPQVVFGLLVSASFFPTLQVQPALGRSFRRDEDEVPGKYPAVVISNGLWGRAFANDPKVIGRQIKLNGIGFTVIGVAPKNFTGVNIYFRPDIYVPTMMAGGMTSDGNDVLTHRGYRAFDMMGRLKPGVTVEQAQAEMTTIMSDLERTYPDTNKDTVAFVRKEMDRRLTGAGLALPSVLMGLVVLVLLIACANVASLLLAKATSRLREISTQLAIGATRGALIRQLLTESALLAFVGGAGGILLGYGCIRGFAALFPYSSSPSGPDFQLDLRVLWVTLAASTLAVFLCGLAPALVAVKEAMMSTTTNARAGSVGGRSYSTVARRLLIGGQIALSTILLIAGALFLKSFSNAQKVDLGFNPEHLLLVTVDPSLRGYSHDKAIVFNQQLLRQVSSIPGVKAATEAGKVPFQSGASWDLSIDGYTGAGGEKFVDTNVNQIGPGYFATMQVPLLEGREFSEQDDAKKPPVAVVNETLARRYIVGEGDLSKAIGHAIRLRDTGPIPIVGVVKDSNNGRIGSPVFPMFYLPYVRMGGNEVTLYLRTEGDPLAAVGHVREQIKALDPDIAPTSVISMETLVSSQGLFMQRIAAILGGAFGVVALTLAVIGLYGVVSFMVGRRTQEIGVRIALGAQRATILRMILVNGISLSAIGLLIGMLGAFELVPLLGGILTDVNPRDPLVFFGIALALVAATLMASWIPANRATQVDPMAALRYE